MTEGQVRQSDLENQIQSLEEKNYRLATGLKNARDELKRLNEVVNNLALPPLTEATVVEIERNQRYLLVKRNGSLVKVGVDPEFDLSNLKLGELVGLNQNMLAVQSLGFPSEGQVLVIKEIVDTARVLMHSESRGEIMVSLAENLRGIDLKAGDSLLVDSRSFWAFEIIERGEVEQLLTPQTPDISFENIGGLSQQVQMVREAIELPLLYPQLYKSYDLVAPKGILLYGPPGCGKTLIAKAVANALSKHGKTENRGAYFLSVKGPQLLSKFVGETERQVRQVFARARELADQKIPVVLFFDEMEALFKVRGSGISSDIETLVVPQLLAEMDGLEKLENVIIIGASNREDMIDPAVLRPGRLDLKIWIGRPDLLGTKQILALYLTADLPYAKSNKLVEGKEIFESLIEDLTQEIFTVDQERAVFDLEHENGFIERIYLKDLVSGAMLWALVQEAKKSALLREANGGISGIDFEVLHSALVKHIATQRSLAASSSPQEWARVLGKVEKIVKIKILEK